MSQRIVNKIQIVIFLKSKDKKIGDGEVLLLKTNQKRGEFWQNITGKMEAGEDPLSAAIRELKEETGLINRPLFDLNYFFDFEKKGKPFREQTFLCLLSEKEHIKIDPQEHNDLKWLKIHDVGPSSYGFPSSFDVFNKAKDYAQKNNLY